jgi:hypothetical protein
MAEHPGPSSRRHQRDGDRVRAQHDRELCRALRALDHRLAAVHLGAFDRYSEVISGIFIAVVGVAFYAWPVI